MKKYDEEYDKLRRELIDVRMALCKSKDNKALKEYEKELLQLMKENLLHQEERRTEIYTSYKGRK